MAASKPNTSISIYAELLSNIRQVSAGVALPSPSDASTSAEVVDGGRRLRVRHQGHSEDLDLPAAVTTSAVLAVPEAASAELSWRLPVSPAEASVTRFSPEGQAVPWNSADIKVGSSICCRECGSAVVHGGKIRSWKDLPSENWAEMMEFWHCHKPHNHGEHEDEALANRGYGANSAITGQPSVGFVDITSFMFAESDCDDLLFSSSSTGTTFSTSSLAMGEGFSGRFLHLFCSSCSTEVGLYCTLALSVTLFKWQVTCETVSPSRPPSGPECLASTLLATISRSGCAKSVIAPLVSEKENASTRMLYLWVLNSNVIYTSSAFEGRRAAMKILYQEIGLDEGNRLMEPLTSDVQDINIPTKAIQAARHALKSSNVLLPERESCQPERRRIVRVTLYFGAKQRGSCTVLAADQQLAGTYAISLTTQPPPSLPHAHSAGRSVSHQYDAYEKPPAGTFGTGAIMHLPRDRYIPAGCIGISKDEAGLSDETWASANLQPWSRFREHSPGRASESDSNTTLCLSSEVQQHLFKTPRLRCLSSLFYARWVDLEFRIIVVDSTAATIRVYLLPDDVSRRIVDRTHPGLAKSRQAVLRELDYSKDAWLGQSLPFSAGYTALSTLSQNDTGDDESLLQVFNRIPSPNPDPNLVNESHFQDAMYELFDGSVSGLTTKLYPYQRRSAALMLQKESAPGRVLDPRLVSVQDHAGSLWYLDPVAGTVLAEPRYYDGISGGILAEEMGAGKTIICLALILATKDFPTKVPELYQGAEPLKRRKIASLADMAASCATRHAVPWKSYFDAWKTQLGYEFSKCAEALQRNPGYYLCPSPKLRREGRHAQQYFEQPATIHLTSASIVITPNNLVAQWKQEITKHTKGLRVLVLTKNDRLPQAESFLEYDMILFSQSRFEKIVKQEGGISRSRLSTVRFKRCIVDEGHKLGNSKIGHRSNLLTGLDSMNFSSRWIVTGTPSHGLFGVDDNHNQNGEYTGANGVLPQSQNGQAPNESSTEMEKKDLQRLGSIASLYLKARPWANTNLEAEDTLADWDTYLLLPKHNPRCYGRWDCLKFTLNSLIIRHQLAEVSDLLPPVDEKIVVLDGSYQDQLSLNVFAMMITFNSVQSQRTDMDYFFHPRQKKSLLQIVHNLKQASFFGGSFFSAEEIAKAVETAEGFLQERKVVISPEDESLLREAIGVGHLAVKNKLRGLSNQFHEMPVCVQEFPGRAGQTWSLDGESGDTVCTSATMLLSLQKLLYNAASEPEQLNSLLNGRLIQQGILERDKILAVQTPETTPGGKEKKTETLAGNTKLGEDGPRKKSRTRGLNTVNPKERMNSESLPAPLQLTTITSTVSAKLSYLIDSISQHQEQEKMIVFYENENIAWYLANMLDVLQIQHLIYARGLTTERRALYVNTFHHNPTFRVLLMDLSQAAFGLDMREASRVYFINPVLNPQVEAQAIGRVRRINQQKPVSVETLVLKNSIDEVILERKRHMTQAEHRQVKSILDIRPIYNWIKNAEIVDLLDAGGDNASQMCTLHTPQHLFGRGFGRTLHPDEGLVPGESPTQRNTHPETVSSPAAITGMKRAHGVGPGKEAPPADRGGSLDRQDLVSRPARRVRFG
ncbi:DNA repair protein rad8 [Tolypocladium ophioglossoides CBS 100239]|uniref:DNA repair protein rad8 n=1 Tax=Tolypocladium ophioglossoides (strain CBS 100239) TaxID=1163406 RepID=A0A0L0N6B2_TOLOC|nr:DNA repair protein rad8 [Tolypocladium ophioglossoides CBS 100239]